MTRSAILLSLMQLRGVGPARLRKALVALDRAGIAIEDALSRGADVAASVGVAVPRAVPAEMERLADELTRRGIRVEVTVGGDLSARSEHLAPVLFVKGDPKLLEGVAVGFCGSRDASARGLEVASDIAGQVAGRGIGVVSGGARGVDTRAHVSALASGGTTTIVLAEGILQWRPRAELHDALDDKRTVVVSEFLPTERWLAARAMQRNGTICALSRAMVLIEARNGGGTFAAGETALRYAMPLFCASYKEKIGENDGNRLLVERGGRAMMMSRASGRANVAPLLDALRGEKGDRHLPGEGDQLSIWKTGAR